MAVWFYPTYGASLTGFRDFGKILFLPGWNCLKTRLKDFFSKLFLSLFFRSCIIKIRLCLIEINVYFPSKKKSRPSIKIGSTNDSWKGLSHQVVEAKRRCYLKKEEDSRSTCNVEKRFYTGCRWRCWLFLTVMTVGCHSLPRRTALPVALRFVPSMLCPKPYALFHYVSDVQRSPILPDSVSISSRRKPTVTV